MKKLHVCIFLVAIVLSSCKEDQTVVNDQLPVVMVHGYFGSGDSFEWIAKIFTSNGYTTAQLFTFDWNTVLQGSDGNTKPLETFIKNVLKKTGAKKVNLMGHSMGGSMSYNFCKDPEKAALVENVVLIAPYLRDYEGIDNPDLTVMNIWSDADYVIDDEGPLPYAENVMLHNIDHNEAAACNETFAAAFKLFTGKDPQTLLVTAEADPLISGKCVSFIENNNGSGTRVEIYKVDPTTGNRLSGSPDYTFIASETGHWGPIHADPTAYYEFRVTTGKPGDRPLHFYREPFTHSDHLVYLRSYPPNTSLIYLALSGVPKSEDQASFIFFSESKALWLGRDELTVNGVSLTNNTFIKPELNTLAIFMYDANRNGVSEQTTIPLFDALQSLKGADMAFPTVPAGSTNFNFNGRVLNIPNRPSKDEGVAVAVFE